MRARFAAFNRRDVRVLSGIDAHQRVGQRPPGTLWDRLAAPQGTPDMHELHLTPLRRTQVQQAFPLVQAIRPQMTLDEWEAFAWRFPADHQARAGIATLQDSNALILGLFAYRAGREPDHGRTLLVDHFVAMDIISPAAVAEHLADSMEALARRLDCRAVHTAVTDGESVSGRHLVDLLRDLGHRLESFQLCKPLPVPG